MGSIGYAWGSKFAYFDKKPTVKKFLDEENTSDGIGHSLMWRVLYSETRNGCYYAAIERTHKESGERDVFAAVQPYHFYGKGWSRELIVKDQDETQGPWQVECSVKLLSFLTEPINDHAASWREKVRAYNETKSPTKLEVNDVLVFEQPLSFGGWGKASRFRVTSVGRKKRYYTLDAINNFPCRLTRGTISHGKFTVEKAG
jgi:hypothetical protein